MRRLLASFFARGLALFRKKPRPANPCDTPRELIEHLMPLVEKALAKRGGKLPANLDEIVAEIHAALPVEVRQEDTAPNRADMAALIQVAALLHYRADRWIKEPW